MKKMNVIVIILVILMSLSGCEKEATVIEPIAVEPEGTKTAIEKVKDIIPFETRRFIYNNGISIEQKNIETTVEMTTEHKVPRIDNYSILSGLKDKAVQEKINKELKETPQLVLEQLEKTLSGNSKHDIRLYEQIYTDSYLSYNFNNVIFVTYSASIRLPFNVYENYPTYKSISVGYDLNTGDRILLADLFKPGVDYKSKINNYICQYLIANNYDDYASERMTMPFQGIRENQSYAFHIEGLGIKLDEKNDEFVNNGYEDFIIIPLQDIGEDLYIFDKYFETGESIYQKDKLTKKLLPNKIKFQATKMTEEGNEKYYIGIQEGQFVNVPDKSIENKLNQMATLKYDVDAFKEKAKVITGSNVNSHFGHYVGLLANEGGLLSVSVSDEENIGGQYKLNRTCFNYNFNLNKEIQLSDLFIDKTNAKNLLKTYIRKLNLPINDEMLDAGVNAMLESPDFNFSESGMLIHFAPRGAKLEYHQEWIWIQYEELGIENISILN